MSSDIHSIQATVARLSHHLDGKRWLDLRTLFADEVDTDYTSLFGGAPQRQVADTLVSGWKNLLGPVATQHLLGPIDVTVAGSSATAECHVRANHYARSEEWLVDGHYRMTLARHGDAWVITQIGLETYHERGARSVLEPR
jgi:hypothetical protein